MAYVVRPYDVTEHRDDRYGSVFELNLPQPSQIKNLGFAFATVDVGKRSPDHHHQHTEEIYHILEGKGRMYLSGESVDVSAGDTVFIPVNTKHSLENTGSSVLRFIVITSPPYDYDDDIEEES